MDARHDVLVQTLPNYENASTYVISCAGNSLRQIPDDLDTVLDRSDSEPIEIDSWIIRYPTYQLRCSFTIHKRRMLYYERKFQQMRSV